MEPQTPLERWLKWFGRHSPQWLEELVRCSGIHNYLPSSVTFSALERQFLANGLRFACTPPSSRHHIYQQHYFNDHARGWPRFDRALSNKLVHGTNTDDDNYVAKFAVKASHAQLAVWADMAADTHRSQYAAEMQLLDRYKEFTRHMLAAHSTSIVGRLSQQPCNVSRSDLAFVRRLMDDTSITIKPADKNLGMVLVSSEWYNAELARMLADRITYAPFDNRLESRVALGQRAGSLPSTRPMDKLQQRLLQELRQLAANSEHKLRLWNPHLADQVLRYLTAAITAETCALPRIYLLIKVHKARLSGRPIVPSTNWITTPASVVVDHLLQEVLQQAAITHLVKDTK